MDASGAAHDSALRSHIAGRGKASANEPLCYRGVQAARDRVFGQAAVAGEEGADFEGGSVAVGGGSCVRVCGHFRRRAVAACPRSHDPQVHIAQQARVWLQSQYLFGVAQEHPAPVRPVVAPRVVQDVGARNAEAGSDAGDVLFAQRPAFQQGRCRKSQSRTVTADPHQTGATFLNDGGGQG